MVQAILDGLCEVGALMPLAAAFALVYRTAGVFHIAVGAIYALAPYVAASCIKVGIPFLGAMSCAVLVGSAVSVALECFNHWPLQKKRSSALIQFVASLGASTVIVQLIVMCWGPDPQALRDAPHPLVHLSSFHLSSGQLLTAAVAILTVAALYAWLPFTSVGLRLRALAANPSEAALRGLNVRLLRTVAFAVSGILASIGGLAQAWDVGFDPYAGASPVLLAIAAVALGGRHSLWGPLLGMLAIGLARGVTVATISVRWQDAVTFLMLAAILVLLPRGLVAYATRAGEGE